ncbi:SpoIVB peptidase S55, partial [gut metagenome]
MDSAVVDTVSRTVDRGGGGTAKVHFAITGTDSKGELLKIDRENMYYSNQELLRNMNLELVEAINVLMQNKLEQVNVYGITVETEVSDTVQVAEITNAVPGSRRVKAGAKVPITVTIKPYRGEAFTETVNFVVPKDHPGGRLPLNVRGGSSMAWIINTLRKQKEEGLPAAQKQERAKSLDDYVKSVNDADKNN